MSCTQCARAGAALASRHLDGQPFCDVDCRDAYIGATHRYRPHPDDPARVLVPVRSQFGELYRAALEPLVGRAAKSADRRDYELARDLVEPIAAALQRIGPVTPGEKHARSSDDDDDNDEQQARKAAAGSEPPPGETTTTTYRLVPPRTPVRDPGKLFGGAYATGLLDTVLQHADVADILRLARAAIGTPLHGWLKSDSFWDPWISVRLPPSADHLDNIVTVQEIITDVATSVYSFLPNEVSTVVWEICFHKLARLRSRSARHVYDTVNYILVTFRTYYRIACKIGSTTLLQFVMRHEYDGVVYHPSIHHGSNQRVFTQEMFQSVDARVSEFVRVTQPGAGVRIDQLIDKYLSAFFETLLGWRDSMGMPVTSSGPGERDALQKFLLDHGMFSVGPRTVAQIARLVLDEGRGGNEYLVSLVCRYLLRAERAQAMAYATSITQVVSTSGVCVDMRVLPSVIGSAGPRRALFTGDRPTTDVFVDSNALDFILKWRHPLDGSIFVDADAVMRAAAADNPAPAQVPLCIPVYLNWRNPATGAPILITRPDLMRFIVGNIAFFARFIVGNIAFFASAQSDTRAHQTAAIDSVIRAQAGVSTAVAALPPLAAPSAFVTDAFFTWVLNTVDVGVSRFLCVDFAARMHALGADVHQNARIISARVFERLIVHENMQAWLSAFVIRDTQRPAAAQDTLALEWVRHNTKAYFISITMAEPPSVRLSFLFGATITDEVRTFAHLFLL